MGIFAADSHLYAPLFGDETIAAIFNDAQFIRFMLDVEAALAVVQGRLGVIPPAAADEIAAAATTLAIDRESLRAGIEKAGVPVVDLVRQLRGAVSAAAADYVHWGATTQDIVDTARGLQLRAALPLLGGRLNGVGAGLARLADAHRGTLMAGRTHSQQALPISFGLKAAGWLAPLLRHRERLAQLTPRLLPVQFGGAAGTLAALGADGPAVAAALAEELGLPEPISPWHTQRDGVVEFGGWLALVSGSLAKMAQDIILLAQSEVAEVRESADSGRGGSSTMPQKHNPVVSELIIAAARSNAGLLANLHQAQIQEHERATHGWQMEWLNLPPMIVLTAAALRHALFLVENLVVDSQKMAQNVAAANGLMLAEALTFALAPAHMSRAAAKQLVGDACQVTLREGRHLVEVVRDMLAARPAGAPPLDWAALRDEGAYLGAANIFIDRILARAEEIR